MRILLYIAAAVQLSILFASAQVPHIFDWRNNLASLPTFLRRLFWVYGAFIVLVIIAFAVLTFLHANEMVAGAPIARSFCAFIAIFWGLRLVVQFAVLDPGPFLTSSYRIIGYHSLTIAFAALVLIYGWAALVPVVEVLP
jgi:hypothetical protein